MDDTTPATPQRSGRPASHYGGAPAEVPEATVRAILLGAVLCVVLGAANTYLGLYAGMTVAASIPAAVVSMAILQGILRGGTVLENSIVQGMASTGESLAAGVIFTVPALVMVGAWQEFRFWPTTMIALLGGLLGVVFMIPLRRALIVDRPDLTYPEGVACAEVLLAGQHRGLGLRTLLAGLGLGAAFKAAVHGVQLVAPVVEAAVARGRSVFYAGSDMSVALLAVGYIVGPEIAVLVTLGGAISWLAALPLIGGYAGGGALDHAYAVWESHLRYLGVGAMLVAGAATLFDVRRGLVDGLRALRRGGGIDPAAVRREERNLPLAWLGVLFLATFAGTVAFYDHLIGSWGLAAVTAAVLVALTFVFVAVATYITGLIGSSNSPVSGMTICALLVASAALLALGIRGDLAVLATLGVAGVVCCATCSSGDIAQDLKTGLLVGSTPARQQGTGLLSVVIAACTFAPVLTLLHRAYGIGTGAPGSLRAPQAALFASLSQGFFGSGSLPWATIGVGVLIGVVLLAADLGLRRRGSRWRVHVMAVAVGIYLPLSLDVPILIGGLLALAARRRMAGGAGEAGERGLLFASGLIAGEALLGIGLAALVVGGLPLPWVLSDGPLLSLLLFAGVVVLFARVAGALRVHQSSR